MLNIDIIKSFDAVELGKFLAAASVHIQRWYNAERNTAWLLEESEDGKLHRANMTWNGNEWKYDKSIYPTTDNWVLAHMNDILEAILAKGDITSYNVQVVIPAIEYGHSFDDFRDIKYYKNTNFHIWSDFFDLKLDDIKDDREAERITEEYMSHYKVINFMLNYEDLVNTIKVYYKNK